MLKPTLGEAKELARAGYRTLPVSVEIPCNDMTPIEALKKLKYVSHHCYLLESAEADKTWGRYSFLGYDPPMEITCTDREMKISAGGVIHLTAQDPSAVLRNILADHLSPRLAGLPPFSGGLVGYFSYDYIKYSEPGLVLDADDEEGFRDCDLMLFNKVIAFDHHRKTLVLIYNIRCAELESDYHKAEHELKAMEELLLHGTAAKDTAGRLITPLKGLFNEDSYCRMVVKAKEYIREGDIFQVVLSNRFAASYEGSLLDTYRGLRAENPSPYMFYFCGDDLEIAGASPETLVKLEDNVLHTFPLAGTRPRGKTEAEDQDLERELLADEKERAEHNMLVDLGRNDLGRISKFGSVKVESYLKVLRFSHVMHIGSTVKGELRDGCDALDAVAAVLPAGTLSGAPKLRACEIINELENNKRGLYGGAIGYIDFSGNLDTCIAIRAAYKKNHKVFIRSGAGIVADSVPQREYQECLNKAQAVINAIEKGGPDSDSFD